MRPEQRRLEQHMRHGNYLCRNCHHLINYHSIITGWCRDIDCHCNDAVIAYASGPQAETPEIMKKSFIDPCLDCPGCSRCMPYEGNLP